VSDRPYRPDADTVELATAAARAADDKLATEIVVLEVGPVLGICDYFVIATAQNERQVKAVIDAVEEQVRAGTGRSPRAEEGKDARRWVLLDYGDVVVHVFHVDERAYYRIERLYGDVPRLEWDEATNAAATRGAADPADDRA